MIWTILFVAGLAGVPVMYIGTSIMQSISAWRNQPRDIVNTLNSVREERVSHLVDILGDDRKGRG